MENQPTSPSAQPSPILRGPGELRVDLTTRRAYDGESEIVLTRQSFDLLAYLVEHQGRVIPNGELIKAIWKHEVVEDRRFLQTAMYRLRAALRAASAVDPIEVVRGVGYSIGRFQGSTPSRSEALCERATLEAAIRNAHVPTMVLDRSGGIALANNAVARLLGYTVEELEGSSTLGRFSPPDQREARAKAFSKVVQGGTLDTPCTVFRRRDGSLITIDISIRPVVIDGEVVGTVVEGSGAPEVQHESAEDRQPKREGAALEAALRMSVVPTVILDGDQRVLLANEAMARLTGYSVAELEALPSAEVLSPPDHRASRMEDLGKIVEGDSLDGAFEPVVLRDGSVIEVDLFAEPLCVDGRIVGVMVQFWVPRGDFDIVVSGPSSPLPEETRRSAPPAG